MARSKIGPIALESPLSGPAQRGFGQSSRVYRALHLEQKKQLVVRIFSTPLGMTPEAKREFANQLEQLKRLRHEQIVRCYGGGFDKQDAYLAYEWIDGESLTDVINRRGRLPWETVMQHAAGLASALAYAHKAEWIHGRIRPDKIIIPRGLDTAMLHDFRRDGIDTWLTSGPPTMGQLAFQSPETLITDSVPTEKSDLYSLGAVLYYMLSGEPPLSGRDDAALTLAIKAQTPPSITSIVMDCPVWLASIIEQCLEKDSAKRPYSATALGMAIQEAQKRSSQGTGVAQHAVSGFSPLKMKADRQEAAKALGIKKERTRPRFDIERIVESPWFLVGILAIIAAFVLWWMKPLGESQLRQRAEILLAADEESGQWIVARDEYLTPLARRFPETENGIWANAQIDDIEMRTTERRLGLLKRLGRDPSTEEEAIYLQGKQLESFGDIAGARAKYEEAINSVGDSEKQRGLRRLAQRQLEQLKESKTDPAGTLETVQNRLSQADKAFESGDEQLAKETWQSIVKLYENQPDLQEEVDQAKQRLRSIIGADDKTGPASNGRDNADPEK